MKIIRSVYYVRSRICIFVGGILRFLYNVLIFLGLYKNFIIFWFDMFILQILIVYVINKYGNFRSWFSDDNVVISMREGSKVFKKIDKEKI